MKKQRRQLVSKLLILLVFVLGVVITCYPFYSDALNGYLDDYLRARHQMTAKENSQQFEALIKKNQRTAKDAVGDPFGEEVTVNADLEYQQQHRIGEITIPKINIRVPIFDETNNYLLEKGVTVVKGTSSPVGGKGSHSGLAGHRGLPQKKLFTDLPSLVIGDHFILDIFGEKLAYQVISSIVVEPTETGQLAVVPEEDLVTLITCTPYMINSHRLLVTGKRIPYTPTIQKEEGDSQRQVQVKRGLIVSGMLAVFFVSFLFAISLIKKYRLGRRIIDLSFIYRNHDNTPLSQIPFTLFDKKGKQMLYRDGAPFTVCSNQEGKVVFSKLPGGLYCIRAEDAQTCLKLGIKKITQKNVQQYSLKGELMPIVTDGKGGLVVKKNS